MRRACARRIDCRVRRLSSNYLPGLVMAKRSTPGTPQRTQTSYWILEQSALKRSVRVLADYAPQMWLPSKGRDLRTLQQRATLQKQRKDAGNDGCNLVRVHGWRNELRLTVGIAKRTLLAQPLPHCSNWPLQTKRRLLAKRRGKWNLAESAA